VIALGDKSCWRRTALASLVGFGLVASGIWSASATGSPFSFTTGAPDKKRAMGSRPGPEGAIEIEAGDDFSLEGPTALKGATFTGLVPIATSLGSIPEVRVEAYRAFPDDSDVSRTLGAPAFSTPLVPTRVNSPSDMAFTQADSADGSLSFTASTLGASSALNSVLNGIYPRPNQTTGGEGVVTGDEVTFHVSFSPPLSLPAGHFFFVPQVGLSSGDFYWLSAPRPSSPPRTDDLQAWIRNAGLSPDWLRVGTDIVGGATPPTFNGSFSLTGTRCSPISVSPAALPAAVAGSHYSVSLGAFGGVSPYSFSASGSVSAGLSLTSGGTLSGTPPAAGSFPIAIAISDADGCTGHVDLSLAVRAAGSVAPTGSAVPPDTKITKAKIHSKRGTATFRFKAVGAASGFQCTLARGHHRKPRPKFRNCRSPKAFRHLKHGRYTFSVRALASTGTDPTPAKRRFRIRRVSRPR
jgi:hypothetical protein